MDATKFGRKSLTRVCGLDEVDRIVTDASVDAVWPSNLRERLVIIQ
jgi:DeoR/GlpR family transcriptional regulator of sugar metabolism